MPSLRRTPTRRRYLMVRPTYFDVERSTRALTDSRDRPSHARLVAQWEYLRDLYTTLGHEVTELAPHPDLPDMVFTSSAATVRDGKALVARFEHPQRATEAAVYLDWFRANDYPEVRQALWINEGGRDHLFAGVRLLAASGSWAGGRPSTEMHEFFDVEVVELCLVDPRYHRLDTALTVLDATTVMYYPPAFSPASRTTLSRLFPDAIVTSHEATTAHALCAVSDGRHVVLPDTAGCLFAELLARGFEPIAADTSELTRAGAGIRACTLELH